MRAWARASRAPATIFMARVIFCVLLTLEIRLRIALRFATTSLELSDLGRPDRDPRESRESRRNSGGTGAGCADASVGRGTPSARLESVRGEQKVRDNAGLQTPCVRPKPKGENAPDSPVFRV